jgi:hypothetical protein
MPEVTHGLLKTAKEFHDGEGRHPNTFKKVANPSFKKPKVRYIAPPEEEE